MIINVDVYLASPHSRRLSAIFCAVIMATLHSGYELEPTQSGNTRRYSTYTEDDTVEELRKVASNTIFFSPIAEYTSRAINTESANTTNASTPREASIYESNVELAPINSNHDGTTPAETDFSLPPVDGGKHAWLFLLSAFILEIIVWGMYFTLLHTNGPLTSPRFSIFIRSLPGILYISPAFCWVTQHRHYWNLRNGPDVPFFANRLRRVRLVSKVTAAIYSDRPVNNVSCTRPEFIEPDGDASHCDARCPVCDWWRTVLQSSNIVPG